ncbi:MAG: hypothetical protein JSU96_01865 [Acidobacteriota bacterium]|nr:MAG: hypothetical protein JSU96_01865 [Acidobacteriota bacterium]
MLEDSPWARQIRVPLPGQHPGEGHVSQQQVYTLRLFSAYPVQAAYLRLLQLSRGYADLTREEQAAFDRQHPVIVGERRGQIVISLDFDATDRETALEIDRRLEQFSTPEMKRISFLSSSTFDRVELEHYSPPSPDGTGAKFVFPRKVDGVDIVSTDGSMLRFEFTMPGTDHRIVQTWDITELSFRGSLTF